jgi:steroid delta-isomerase-like uncharacterized protein
VLKLSIGQGLIEMVGHGTSRRGVAKLTMGALLGGAVVARTGAAPARAQDATPAADETCPTTSAEENIAIVERYWSEVWTAGGEAAVAELLAEDEIHHWGFGGTTDNLDDYTERLLLFFAAFPDMAFRVDLAMADGDMVATRWTATGTHEGPWLGIEPTGATIEYTGMQMFRIACGKIAESWGEANHLSLLEQLGALPDLPLPDGTPTG